MPWFRSSHSISAPLSFALLGLTVSMACLPEPPRTFHSLQSALAAPEKVTRLILAARSPDRRLADLKNLESLKISAPLADQKIEAIRPPLALSNLKKLKELEIFGLDRSDLPVLFKTLNAGIQVLRVYCVNPQIQVRADGQAFANIAPQSPDIKRLSQLRRLALIHCALQAPPTGLKDAHRLTSLNLSSNSIKIFTAPLPPGVRSLHLADNLMEQAPVLTAQLTDVDLAGNRLTRAPRGLRQATELKELFLDRNLLPDFNPPALPALHTLTLNQNRLTRLPDSFCNLRDLRILNLSRNALTTLPACLGELKHLNRLDISLNDIRVLPGGILNLSDLRFLFMRKSRISLKKRRQLVKGLPDTMIYFD